MNTLSLSYPEHGGMLLGVQVDGEPFYWLGQELPGSLYDFILSLWLPGNYFLLTCTCGMFECAGLEFPIRVRHDSDRIFWDIEEPTPARMLVFDRTQYAGEVQRMIAAKLLDTRD